VHQNTTKKRELLLRRFSKPGRKTVSAGRGGCQGTQIIHSSRIDQGRAEETTGNWYGCKAKRTKATTNLESLMYRKETKHGLVEKKKTSSNSKTGGKGLFAKLEGLEISGGGLEEHPPRSF